MKQKYYFAEIVERQIIAFHESTSLDLIFRDSDGLLVELNEKEYDILKACGGDIVKGIQTLKRVQDKLFEKITENS